jgi:hypothetical protein
MHGDWRELADTAHAIAQNNLSGTIGAHWHDSVASPLAVSNYDAWSLAHSKFLC